MTRAIDQLDIAILIEMRKDLKPTVRELAKIIQRSTTTVQERLERLERDGYIVTMRAGASRGKTITDRGREALEHPMRK
jgi:DNA-binding Lrp family transcriptional regulator